MDRVLQVLLDQLESEVENVKDNLGDGRAKDYADYQYRCGVLRGLLTASSFIQDLARNMENFDE